MSRTENTPKQIPVNCITLNLSLKYSFETITLQNIEKTDMIGNKTDASTFEESTKVDQWRIMGHCGTQTPDAFLSGERF